MAGGPSHPPLRPEAAMIGHSPDANERLVDTAKRSSKNRWRSAGADPSRTFDRAIEPRRTPPERGSDFARGARGGPGI